MAPPRLTEEDLLNPDLIWGLVDGMMVEDKEFWRLTRHILKVQLQHQTLAPEPVFELQLQIEAAWDLRTQYVLAAAVRWAFMEGKLSSAPDGEAPPENS